MDFDEDDLGNSQDSQQFRQGYQSQVLSNHPTGCLNTKCVFYFDYGNDTISN